ncbi:transposase [Holospora obtusa]|uniref:transposase n=1 Tax=Holospora obtusa TaxID=49893 RepID=UPI0003AEEF3D
MISSWLFEGKRVGRGKKPKYSDAAIKFLLIIFEIYSLRLRQLEGFARFLFKTSDIVYSFISKRYKKPDIEPLKSIYIA